MDFKMTEVDTLDSISVSIRDGVLCVATASIDRLPSHWWVSRVLVREKYRRQGMGKKCLQRAIEIVKSRKGTPRRIIVAPGGYDMDPEQQRKFYEAQGFRRVNRGVLVLPIGEEDDRASPDLPRT